MPLNFLERIADHYHKKLPFVAYRKPKEDAVKVIFQKDDELHHLKTYTETGFVLAPFDAEQPTVLLHPDEYSEIFTSEFLPSSLAKDSSASTTDQKSLETHIRLVKKGIDAIDIGLFKKVVLSRCLEIASSAPPLSLFTKLLAKYPNAFCYLWYHPKVGLWLGATPEILLMQKNRQLITMSLAGTQKFTGTENPVWGTEGIRRTAIGYRLYHKSTY